MGAFTFEFARLKSTFAHYSIPLSKNPRQAMGDGSFSQTYSSKYMLSLENIRPVFPLKYRLAR
jgi:hypothetical protein